MSRWKSALGVAFVLPTFCGAIAGCSSSKGGTTITVSAASSLTDAFQKVGNDFEAAHPGTAVRFNFDSSSALTTQIESGAPADVFASADTKNMTTLTDAGVVEGSPERFARNKLVIVVKPGNPSGVKTVADLANLDTVSMCGADVPCGKYAQQVLDTAQVSIPKEHITRGQNAKATLTAVTAGDADAAIVYVTDARAAGDAVATIAIPTDVNVVADYPIAVVKASTHSKAASQFVDYVTSDTGQATLRSYGFLSP